MKVLHVVGARPNFMKTEPVMAEMERFPECFEQLLVHTGQHYDYLMSRAFFEDLQLREPDIHLDVGSGSHAQQSARIMMRFEEVLEAEQPDLVVVVGDVNSTLACALVASKLSTPVAHVEAGLRSFDRTMPEEINRLLTDAIADYLFTPSEDADRNLCREGVPPEKVFLVGNAMVDSLRKHEVQAAELHVLHRFGVSTGNYILVTLHRPSNVDDPDTFRGILDALTELAQDVPTLFPAHPRTLQRMAALGLEGPDPATGDPFPVCGSRLLITPPLRYLEFLHLQMHARLVLTDSGGIQEETTVLGVPCLTLRANTERPITVEMGTNRLVGSRKEEILQAVQEVLAAPSTGTIPPLWDGRTAERIVQVLRAPR